MDTGIDCSLGTSYFRIADQLSGEELSYLRRTRDLVDSGVLDSGVLPAEHPKAVLKHRLPTPRARHAKLIPPASAHVLSCC